MPRRTTRTDPAPPRPLADQAAGVPVLPGTLTVESGRHGEPVLLLVVKCPVCRTAHTHTWGPAATGPFHRAAHCADGSPLRSTGYYVECPDSPHNRSAVRQYQRLRTAWEAAARRRGPHLLTDLTGSPLVEVMEVLPR